MRRSTSVWKRSVLIFMPVLFAGCAAQGKSTWQHIPAETYTIESSKTFEAPFAQVWDALLKGLSETPFSIISKEKTSGNIIASFSSDTPEIYIDCGKTHRTYSSGWKKIEYDYHNAASVSYKESGKSEAYGYMPVKRFIDIKTVLDGQLNIRVEPFKKWTRVSVNSSFVWTKQQTGEYIVIDELERSLAKVPLQPVFTKCAFSTRQQGRFSAVDDRNSTCYITCVSNGKLEQMVLDLAQ